jgi:hypothetical protein
MGAWPMAHPLRHQTNQVFFNYYHTFFKRGPRARLGCERGKDASQAMLHKREEKTKTKQ